MRAQRQDLRRHPRRLLAVLGALTLAPALGGCSEPLNEPECARLLDHYVQLLVQARMPDAPIEEVLKAQTTTRDVVTRSTELARCSEEISRAEYDCALRAENPDLFEQCLL